MTRILALVLCLWFAVGGVVEASSRPAGVQVLYYSRGVMERVARCHMTRGCGDGGDYVPTLRLRPDRTGLTAVNWNSRWMVGANVIIVAQLWNPVKRQWGPVERLQPADWQQRRHSTGNRQRLEVDWNTARRAQFTRDGTTVARIIRIER